MSSVDSPSDEHIARLLGMGFTEFDDIIKALQQANNDVNKAVAILTESFTETAPNARRSYISPHMRSNDDGDKPHTTTTNRGTNQWRTKESSQISAPNPRRSYVPYTRAKHQETNSWRRKDDLPASDKQADNARRSEWDRDWRQSNRDNQSANIDHGSSGRNRGVVDVNSQYHGDKPEPAEDVDEDYFNIPMFQFNTQRGRSSVNRPAFQGVRGRGRGTRRNRGTGRGGNWGQRSIPINHIKLEEWNKYDYIDNLTTEIYGEKDEMISLLNNADMDSAIVQLLVQIFAKVTKCSRRQTMLSVLAFLHDSLFMLKHVPQNIDYLRQSTDDDNKLLFAQCLVQIISEYFVCFPGSFTDMPIEKLEILVETIVENENVKREVDVLLNQKEELLRSVIEKRIKRCEISDCPPNDFREMDTFPTIEEIHCKEKPYLRPVMKVGSYNDQEHYLDVQYRLMKEDLVSPLRDGIREIVTDMKKNDQKISLKAYYGVKLLHPICTNKGFTYRIMFDTTNLTGIPWNLTRKLIFGSLVCLSNDKFQTMVFATIADRKPEDLQHGQLDIRFKDTTTAIQYCRTKEALLMVECPSYFEAYRHVLDSMKQITVVPFPQYIIYYTNDAKHPPYLTNKSDIVYDLSNISKSSLSNDGQAICQPQSAVCKLDSNKNKYQTKILKEDQWPVFTDTSLNKSQLKAFMNAITKEFTVIQGPPGTGKTHVGLRIADVLLQNKNFWNNENEVPMLIVCYTNHALDQFLKGLIEFGHKNIIRVGGRSSEELSEYNLRKHVHHYSSNEHTRDAKRHAYMTKEEIANKVTPYVTDLQTLHDTLMMGKLLDYELLSNVMSPQHYEYLNLFKQKCRELRVSVFDIFLGLLHISPQNIWNMRMVQQPFYGGTPEVAMQDDRQGEETIAVEGEGEVLTDRWGVNVNDYRRDRNTSDAHNVINYDQNCIFVDNDGFQTVQPSKKDKKRRVKENLSTATGMSENEAMGVSDPWQLNLKRRWQLYMYWVDKFVTRYREYIEEEIEAYENACKMLNEIHEQEEEVALKGADVIAMTTTCAARYRRSLSNIKPKIVIIEEAAEVLEAHVIASLSEGLEHLILIGDHKQLKPNPAVFELAKKYSLEVSLFERMVNNGMQCHTLDIQHRMRPEIAHLVRHIYPKLQNHESVLDYPNVKGVQKNLLFIKHNHAEMEVDHFRSKSNMHEAEFIKGFCRYLIQQGYNANQITILTAYTGQLITIKNIMPRSEFEGVRVTAIDNFQGEENDIILLSLVRSNLDGKIGFLKTENRICVALSRAKIGLFVIGNFDLLEKESQLWKNIIHDLRYSDSIKDHLALQCENHPDTVVHVQNGKDFSCAPEGGCTKPCEFRLNCGHVCQMACHPSDQQHEKYVCIKKCDGETLCMLDHRCPRRCHYGEECGPCPVMVDKSIKLCGHIQRMKCWDDPGEFLCREKCSQILLCGHNCKRYCGEKCEEISCNELVTKKMESCGHTQVIRCSEDVKEVTCISPCNGQLDCLHKCIGTCGGCDQGRMHVKCMHACNRLLVCSHSCDEPCISDCPPCKRKCENSCFHSKCQKICGEVCTPCTEPCQWRCEHLVCQKRCYQTCDRDRCNMPCQKDLKCGHKCIGLCGEICPSLCRICHRDLVEEIFFGTESEEHATFIVLTDCDHMFEHNALDQWMEIDVEEGSIKLKECPKCKTPVRKSLRYGNIVKAMLSDINQIKQKISDSDSGINNLKAEGYKLCKQMFHSHKVYRFQLNDFPDEEQLQQVHKLDRYLDSKNPSIRMVGILYSSTNLTEATRYLNIITMLMKIQTLKSKINSFLEEVELIKLVDKLVSYLTEKLSPQQYRQGQVELQRLYLMFNIYEVKQHLGEIIVAPRKNEKEDDDLEKDYEHVDSLLHLFQNGKPISLEKMKTIVYLLKEIQKRHNIGSLTAADKEMIIKAVGLGKGHWYKCKNGHYYAIGECGGATETGTCPECKSEIGGTSHTLVEGNQHACEFDGSQHAAYSEEANNMMNFDEIQLLVLP